MNELTYLPVTDRNGNYFELGLLSDGQWFSVYASHGSDSINGYFTDKLDEITSIKVSVDAGTATFRKENSKYWYAYKKLKGKLNKIYIGSSDVFTELAIVTAVESANTPKAVTQNVCVTDTDKPLVELAGNKKDENHIQQCLITENEALAMANETIERLKLCNADLEKKIVDLDLDIENAMIAAKVNRETIDNARSQVSNMIDKEKRLRDLVIRLEKSKHEYVTKLDEQTNENYKLTQKYDRLLEERNCEGYMYQQQLDWNFENITELTKLKTIIDKHRALATGKTKQGHPRFNKLLEFLEDIDKDCLSI